jgi:putative membrane protein
MSPQEPDTEPPGGGRFDSDGDATRRTRLANERTYLAWWRTGLTSLAVSLGAGRLVPALTSGGWPYELAGATFALLGMLFIGYAFVRYRAVERAVERGEFARPDARFVAVLAVVGVLVGLLVLAIVLVGR